MNAGTTADPELLATTIRRLAGVRGAGKTICPSEVARELAGRDEKRWRLLMTPIRKVAVGMALRGEIELRRKGRLADPDRLKGIYRIGLPAQSDGDGNSRSIRPESR